MAGSGRDTWYIAGRKLQRFFVAFGVFWLISGAVRLVDAHGPFGTVLAVVSVLLGLGAITMVLHSRRADRREARAP